MTEYELFGVLFFGSIAIVIITAILAEIVCNRRNKRDLQKAMKVYDRMKKVEKVAVFTALATAYGKNTKNYCFNFGQNLDRRDDNDL